MFFFLFSWRSTELAGPAQRLFESLRRGGGGTQNATQSWPRRATPQSHRVAVLMRDVVKVSERLLVSAPR